MPPTQNSAAPEFFGESDLVVRCASIFATAGFYRALPTLSNFALGIQCLNRTAGRGQQTAADPIFCKWNVLAVIELFHFLLEKQNPKLEILTMTSTITTKGQTVVPKELRRKFELDSGAVLDWRADGDSMRVVKLTRSAKGGFIQALRRLGRVPAAPRDHRLVEDA
jgi:bifunctional DNA-binding transcriptional regulator/antitoxin component of YhaV-PrlF toxin-antitoxin module